MTWGSLNSGAIVENVEDIVMSSTTLNIMSNGTTESKKWFEDNGVDRSSLPSLESTLEKLGIRIVIDDEVPESYVRYQNKNITDLFVELPAEVWLADLIAKHMTAVYGEDYLRKLGGR